MSNEKGASGHGDDRRRDWDNNLLYESTKKHGNDAVGLDGGDDKVEYLLHEF